jgi:hypothetical protein
MRFNTYDTKKKKIVKVGEIVGSVLFKLVNPSKHFMRVVDGYGIQWEAFNRLEEKGVDKIIIKENTGNQWSASLKDWMEHSKVADYGSGKQVFLSLKYMTCKRKPIKAEPEEEIKEENKQEVLF